MILIDNFLSEDKFSWCKDNQEEIFSLRVNTSEDPGTMWWSGWWSEPASNMCEELVQMIFNNSSLISYLRIDDIEKFSGFEYWTHTLTKHKQLDWHVDTDERALFKGEGYLSPPISAVFYFSEPRKGGFLEIALTGRGQTKNMNMSNIERIKPLENRLVVFDPRYWHRVSELTGTRCGITINIWDQSMSLTPKRE